MIFYFSTGFFYFSTGFFQDFFYFSTGFFCICQRDFVICQRDFFFISQRDFYFSIFVEDSPDFCPFVGETYEILRNFGFFVVLPFSVISPTNVN